MEFDSLKGRSAADHMKKELIAAIRSGELRAGERILSERKLALQYKISYMTVHRAIEELVEAGYLVKEPRRGIFVRETFFAVGERSAKVLAFVALELNSEVIIELLTAAEKRARRYGYFLLVCNSVQDVAIERFHLQKLLTSNIAGVIFIPIGGNHNIDSVKQLNDNGVPVITIDNIYQDEQIDSIDCDNYDLGYKAASYLIENGHRNIAHITVSQENFRNNYVAQKRVEGFFAAMKEANIPCSNDNILFLPWEYTSLPIAEINLDNLGYEQARRLLLRKNPPTAISVAFDEIAWGVYRAAADLKVSIPQELSVIGINNTALSRRLVPGLTTLAQPFSTLGVRAVEILLGRNAGLLDRENIKEEFFGSLIVRGSVMRIQ